MNKKFDLWKEALSLGFLLAKEWVEATGEEEIKVLRIMRKNNNRIERRKEKWEEQETS